ncbi:hypothetical protein IKG07_03235 [Candidatus Saccharibacteria bacterium]|nr:hypothetical protein [Candidatus Saccharibacteria bacterium]
MLKVVHKSTFSMCVFALAFLALGVSSSNASATDVDYNVSIAPALTLTIPSNPIIINLDPSSKTFDSKDFTISVGTNNRTGYTLTLSTPNDGTNLNRDTTSDGISAIMPTLDPGTYTQSSFTADKWGYKINSNTSIPSTITSGYVPFQSGNTLMESDTAVNHDEAELSLAAKIDYLQASGSYSTTLQFNIVAHPVLDYMQNFTPAMCRTLASSSDYTVMDKRDNKEYTVRWINGSCWMTSNLNLAGGTKITSSDSNITDAEYTLPADSTAGFNDYVTANMHCSGNDNTGCWYNYKAVSAGTISGSSVSSNASHDICPKGWRLPMISEQIGILSYASEYNPVVGGYYYNSNIYTTNAGKYWSSTVSDSTHFYYMGYDGNSMVAGSNDFTRDSGIFARCILNDTRTLSDITYMQDMNPQIVKNTSIGATKVLKDKRDNEEYTVAKLADDRIWMADNLNLGATALTENLTKLNTNLETTIDAATFNSWKYASSIPDTYTAPVMAYTGGGIDSTSGTKYGMLYNYCAASATSICTNSNSTLAQYDLCPAGWRLPTGGSSSSEIGALRNTYYNTYAKMRAPLANGGAAFALAGDFVRGSVVQVGSEGYYYSATAYDATERYGVFFFNSSYHSTDHGARTVGRSVRCIARY